MEYKSERKIEAKSRLNTMGIFTFTLKLFFKLNVRVHGFGPWTSSM